MYPSGDLSDHFFLTLLAELVVLGLAVVMVAMAFRALDARPRDPRRRR